jgi:hypothetical protein
VATSIHEQEGRALICKVCSVTIITKFNYLITRRALGYNARLLGSLPIFFTARAMHGKTTYICASKQYMKFESHMQHEIVQLCL